MSALICFEKSAYRGASRRRANATATHTKTILYLKIQQRIPTAKKIAGLSNHDPRDCSKQQLSAATVVTTSVSAAAPTMMLPLPSVCKINAMTQCVSANFHLLQQPFFFVYGPNHNRNDFEEASPTQRIQRYP